MKITGIENISQIFRIFHDGAVVKHLQLPNQGFRLEIEIRYLAQQIDPAFTKFHLTLDKTDGISFSAWMNDPNLAPRTLLDLDEVFKSEYEILSVRVHGNQIAVYLNQPLPKSDYCGGEFYFSAESATVQDEAGNTYSLEQLETISKGYWDRWYEKAKDRKAYSEGYRIRSGYVPIGNASLYYEEFGKGLPLILIHGGQLDCRMWDTQFQSLGQRYRVIRYDVRGHGNSSSSPEAYSDYDDLLRVMEHLHVDQAAIIGLSLGSIIAAGFALAYPAKVSALVLVSPALSGEVQPSEEVIEKYGKILEAAEAGNHKELAEYFLQAWVDGPKRPPEQVDPGVRQAVHEMVQNNIQQGQDQSKKQPLLPPARERLSELKVPVLTIAGDLDFPDIHETCNLLSENVSGTKTVTIADAAHTVNMEQPTEFNRAVLDFLENIPWPNPIGH